MDIFSFKQEIEAIKRLNPRQLVNQGITALYSLVYPYMLWKLLCIFLDNDSPIVCVLSGSMEPGFKRGDILFLKPKDYSCGDMVVYQVYEHSIPIIHRVIRKDGNGKLLTKGDNNLTNDIPLYKPGRTSLDPDETRAGVFGYVPFFGMPTVWISSVPGLRQAILLFIALSVFFSRQ